LNFPYLQEKATCSRFCNIYTDKKNSPCLHCNERNKYKTWSFLVTIKHEFTHCNTFNRPKYHLKGKTQIVLDTYNNIFHKVENFPISKGMSANHRRCPTPQFADALAVIYTELCKSKLELIFATLLNWSWIDFLHNWPRCLFTRGSRHLFIWKCVLTSFAAQNLMQILSGFKIMIFLNIIWSF
jgi:hypothetical protein